MKKDYWNKLAKKYDLRSKRYHKMYNKLISLLRLELSQKDIVLDIGTGTGEIPLSLSSEVKEFQGIDLSNSMINIAKEKILKSKITNVSFSVQNSYNLQSKNDKFNVVIIANLLHIVNNPEKVIKEANRILKNKGKLIIATYLHGNSIKTKVISFFLKLKGHPVYNQFNEKRMINLVKSNDLEIIKKEMIDNIIPVLFIVAKKK
jgi:ubiquinone/menaquinone biosynthesis C-methylase UbiE